jgi:hypothetical protein
MDDRRSHQVVPRRFVAVEEFPQRHRHGGRLIGRQQQKRVGIFIRIQQERIGAAGDESRRHQRQVDAEEYLRRRGAVDARGPIQFVRNGRTVLGKDEDRVWRAKRHLDGAHGPHIVGQPVHPHDPVERNDQVRIALSIRPHWPFGIQWNEMNVGMPGTAQGGMKFSSRTRTTPFAAHEETGDRQCHEHLQVQGDCKVDQRVDQTGSSSRARSFDQSVPSHRP